MPPPEGQGETLRLCGNAFVQDHLGRVLLTRRADNGLWCLPGGHVEWGETLEQAVCRETWEETGLKISVGSLIGLYSDPFLDRAVPEGSPPSKGHRVVVALFSGSIIKGKMQVTEETTDVGFFMEEDPLTLWRPHVRRIRAGFEKSKAFTAENAESAEKSFGF